MKHPETVLEINLTDLTSNYTYLKNKIRPEVKMMAVVKAFGYGSDAVAVAKHLEALQIDYFAVAYAPEGVQLRRAGITTPILVLHPQPGNFELLLDYDLEPNLYSQRVLELFITKVKTAAKQAYPIHIKYNSGLNRIGFSDAEIPVVLEHLCNAQEVKVVSLLSHLAASEEHEERAFTLEQIARFTKFSEQIIAKIGYTPLMHCTNTSGILNYPEAHFSMVRCGIGLYGFGNDAVYDKNLFPIASLRSVISQIHELTPGDSVGYNRTFVADKPMRSATIPLGHADGIGRQYGQGKGFVMINGNRAYILGNVCMDMIMVDVTDIDCEEGTRVVLFGKDMPADVLAGTTGSISYELITGVSARVIRQIVD